MTPKQPATAAIRKALGIGFVSWDGDGWYATQGPDGVDYDEAEAAFKEAYAALDDIEAEAFMDGARASRENRKEIEAEAAAPTSGSLREALRDYLTAYAKDCEAQWPDTPEIAEGVRMARAEAWAFLTQAALAEPEGLDVDWPDPNALATALYRDYDYTVTPEDIRDAYTRLMRERQP